LRPAAVAVGVGVAYRDSPILERPSGAG